MYEKFVLWSTHHVCSPASGEASGDVESTFLDRDEMLDHVMLYWLSGTETSAMRMYWEVKEDTTAVRIPARVKVGVSLFPGDAEWACRGWGERYYEGLVYWEEAMEGGHFAAWERPKLFAGEVRAFVGQIVP